MTIDDLLKQGFAACKAGRNAEARKLLTQVLEQDERNEKAWLWLTGVVDTDEERTTCLENVLAINPNNEVAQRGMKALRKSSPELDSTSVAEASRSAKSESRAKGRLASPENIELGVKPPRRWPVMNWTMAFLILMLVGTQIWTFSRVSRLEKALIATQARLAETQAQTNLQASQISILSNELNRVASLVENANRYANSHGY
jgi:hypothetical protein